MKLLITGGFPLLVAFAITALAGPVFIPWLKKLKFGQEIREEGPAWHQKKSGTPTMGGLMFILGIAIAVVSSYFITALSGGSTVNDAKAIIVLLASVGFGAIGFADDFIKVVKKRNLGFRALPKFTLQILLTVMFLVSLMMLGQLSPKIIIPFFDITLNMPLWLYFLFAIFVMTGTVNAVNLTDGLDGLATSVTIPVILFFAISAYGQGEMGIFSFGFAAVGGLLGFLIYNKFPAKVFMGDTGSLFLGGAVVVSAIALKMHLYLVIAGFIYFAEALSVILQVASFKITGKRIFKMSPIHHHFEMCGWREVKIVLVFTAVTIVLCAVSALI